jgi:hypothetical protein
MKRFMLSAVAGLALAFYMSLSPTPSCTAPETLGLVKTILSDQLGLGTEISVQNVRVTSGNIFSRRYECDAEVSGLAGATAEAGKMFGVSLKWVHYTSEITADTGRQYVTARLVPMMNRDQ